MQTVKNPPPRMLRANESLHSLNHWKTTFRTYYRRDAYFKAFLLPTSTWTNSATTHHGQTEDRERETVTQSAADKGDDLQDILHTLLDFVSIKSSPGETYQPFVITREIPLIGRKAYS